jgi:hypothetical protein
VLPGVTAELPGVTGLVDALSLTVESAADAVVLSVAGAVASVAGAVLSVDSDSPPPQAVKANPAISKLMATRIVLVDLNIGDCFVYKTR